MVQMKREEGPFTRKPKSEITEYSISRFHLARHILGLVLTSGFCFSLFMSELSYRIHPHAHFVSHVKQNIGLYLLMLLFVSVIAITTILTVRKVKISAKEIEISNLLWHEKLGEADLLTFRSPETSNYAWLRTKRIIYLFAKKEFKSWIALEMDLKSRLFNQTPPPPSFDGK